MSLMRAVQISKQGSDFELVQKEIPKPKENEVRIKVQACGVCHGEAIVKEGYFPDIKYPRVLGHEVVGTIDKLGSNVSFWEIGQRVSVGCYGGPCLTCEACRKGCPSNCASLITTGISFDGGYAEFMVAPTQPLSIIPDELSSLDASPLLYAGEN
jgi:D-arabinose 1-dehydrogenase-like Zn-dependent alcohol dehydrogenase